MKHTTAEYCVLKVELESVEQALDACLTRPEWKALKARRDELANIIKLMDKEGYVSIP